MTVHVEFAGCDPELLAVTFRYDERLVEAMRTVSGRKWSKPCKHWHVPKDLESCRGLRRAFGKDLTIGPLLRSWAFAQTRAEATLGSLALAVTAEGMNRLPSVLPKAYQAVWLGPLGRYMTDEEKAAGMKGPGSYQAADTLFLANSIAPLNGNDPGTGKTLEWIAAVWEAGLEDGTHLVVCPKAAIDNTWEKELLNWQSDAQKTVEVFACTDHRDDREAVLERFRKSTADVRWVVVNPAMVAWRKDPTRTSRHVVAVTGSKNLHAACFCSRSRKPHEHYESPYPMLHDIEWRTVCIDEAHKGSVRNHRSITSKGMSALKRVKPCIMTGTPMKKHGGHDIWGLLNWLRPDVFTSSWRFWGTYFEITESLDERGRSYGKKVGELLPGMQEEFFKAMAPYMLRRTKAEVAPWLPPKLYVPVDCWMGKKQAEQYRKMEKEGAFLLADGVSQSNVVGTLAQFTRLKQFANALCEIKDGRFVPVESCKVEALLEKMDECSMFDEGETRKQLVFSQSLEMIKYVAAILRERGLKVGVISGESGKKSSERKALVDGFQEGDIRVMCIVTTAGGVSLTLDAADEVHLLDEMWSPDEDMQAEDRAHRVSRVHQVTVYVYRTLDTIDQYVQETKEAKAVTHAFIMDVRRQLADKWMPKVA